MRSLYTPVFEVTAISEEVDKEKIVVNDVFGYVQCMVDTLHRDQLVKTLVNHYANEQELITARDVFFKIVPADILESRLIYFKEKTKIAGSIFDVIHKIGTNDPQKVYLCRNIRNTPLCPSKVLIPLRYINNLLK